MASVFAHAVFAGAASTSVRPSWSVAALGAFCSVLPDADVLAFSLGIPYEHPLGHRGATHSIAFAVGVGLLVFALARRDPQRGGLGIYAAFATLSHGLLDALTTGGEGVGFLIPFSAERFFFPFRPIRVSPIGAEAFFSERGVAVLLSEAVWVGIPAIALGLAGWIWWRSRDRGQVRGVEPA